MKLTKNRLKEIIREEIQKLNEKEQLNESAVAIAVMLSLTLFSTLAIIGHDTAAAVNNSNQTVFNKLKTKFKSAKVWMLKKIGKSLSDEQIEQIYKASKSKNNDLYKMVKSNKNRFDINRELQKSFGLDSKDVDVANDIVRRLKQVHGR